MLGVPDAHDIDRLSRGIVIDGRRTSPAQVELLRERRTEGDTSVLRVTIHEGRTRQVRKMADAIGHPVRALKRVRIGPIADKNLRLGSYRELTAEEVRKLKHSGKRSQPPASRAKKTNRRSGDQKALRTGEARTRDNEA